MTKGIFLFFFFFFFFEKILKTSKIYAAYKNGEWESMKETESALFVEI